MKNNTKAHHTVNSQPPEQISCCSVNWIKPLPFGSYHADLVAQLTGQREICSRGHGFKSHRDRDFSLSLVGFIIIIMCVGSNVNYYLLMHGSILPVTICPLGIPPGVCNFFLPWWSIPHPRVRGGTIPPPRDSSSTTNTLFCVQNINNYIDFRTIAKPDILTRT